MLDKIMEMVGGDALNEITSKAGISLDQAKQMLPFAKDSLEEGISQEVKTGNMENLLGMFNSAGSSGLMNNGLFGNIKNMFMKKIMTNMGLPESIAGLAANSGLGSIVGNLAGKLRADGDNDDVNMSNITNILGGGGAAGILGSLLGKGGGIMDSVKDVAGGLLGGDSKKEEQGGGLLGGLKDAAGGLFGK